MNGQIIFIIWRESVEALLVVGILAGWLAHEGAGRRASLFLWGGVAAGIAVALALAAALMGFSGLLTPDLRQSLMTAMVFLAAALILQMVVWMRRHGRTLKRDIEQGLRTAAEHRNWWGVFVLALVAVAREGSETVIFLYGALAASHGAALGSAALSITTGFAVAFASYLLLRAGARFMPWRSFFRITEVMLLLLGCSLFVTGVGDLVAAGLLPFGAPLWDSSALLDDGTRFGGLVASLTGYRAQPDLVTVLAWLVYWGIVLLALRLQPRPGAARVA